MVIIWWNYGVVTGSSSRLDYLVFLVLVLVLVLFLCVLPNGLPYSRDGDRSTVGNSVKRLDARVPGLRVPVLIAGSEL